MNNNESELCEVKVKEVSELCKLIEASDWVHVATTVGFMKLSKREAMEKIPMNVEYCKIRNCLISINFDTEICVTQFKIDEKNILSIS